jgi:membrane protein implicated in regulation of membrane protease activity
MDARDVYVEPSREDAQNMGTPRLMIVFMAATGFVVAAIAVLAFQTWWALAIALAAHAIASIVVIGYAYRQASQAGKPDPVTEARLEEEKADKAERRRKTGQINPARDYEVF